MNTRDDLDRMVSLLRDGPIALPAPDAASASRERALAAMRALIAGTPRRLRRRQRLRTTLLATGVVACAAIGWLEFGQREPRPLPAMLDTVLVEMPKSNQATWSDGSSKPQLLGTRSRVPLRGTLHSLEDNSVTLRTPQGVQVAMKEKSEVGLAEVALAPNRSVLNLHAGQIRCKVPRLPAGSAFSVRTGDAEVIVHGTVFSVQAPNGAVSTCVRVDEGRVEVRRYDQYRMLEAGSSFGCEAALPTSSSVDASSSSSQAPTEKTPAAAASTRRPAAVVEHPRAAIPSTNAACSGTLAEESRLLAAALVKEREGSRAKARELFLTLLTRYPQSALAVEARAGLARTRESDSR